MGGVNIEWASALAAFGGGILGAAVGAVPVFVFTGLIVLAGVAAAAGGGDTNLIGNVAFGPFLGPHVSFAGAVAAAAYAGKKGLIPTGRDIGMALMGLNDPLTLIVGGVFGVAGYLLNQAIAGLAPWTDTIAFSVVALGFISRGCFGKTSLIGTVAPGGRRFSPSEVANWLPWQQKWSQLIVIGIAVGLLSCRLAQILGPLKGGGVVGFGIVTSFLILLLMGNKIPVTHHIAITSALAATLGAGLVTCAIVGILAAFIGEGVSRAVHIHGDTHIDPPAGAIAIVTVLLRVADSNGLFGLHLP